MSNAVRGVNDFFGGVQGHIVEKLNNVTVTLSASLSVCVYELNVELRANGEAREAILSALPVAAASRDELKVLHEYHTRWPFYQFSCFREPPIQLRIQ